MLSHRKYEPDLLDKTADKCCDSVCCAADHIECIHNLDRIYLKIACLIITAMLFGCVFIIDYYYQHGKSQANDAMFLSLEAIGDRAAWLMNLEFWVPQMANSLTIGGLTTGDLLPNASLYTFPHCKFDQFFASFSTVQHTAAVFSVFMYNHELNTMIGAYKEPDVDYADGFDNDTVIILYYNGTCRKDRLYDSKMRMRTELEPFTRTTNKNLKNYLNCDFDPRARNWYEKGQEIGVGRSQWTEPFMFIEDYLGMSYVAPVTWQGQRLTFVVEVTTYTLAVAVSKEVQQLPGGADTFWMIVTPGLNAVASSNNDTLIDHVANCTQCTTSDPMMIAGIDWMHQNNVTGKQHFSALTIDPIPPYQISLYSFKMNHVNLHPPQGYASDEWMVKPLQLNSPDDYQHGFFAIMNNDDYLNDVNNALFMCLIITIWSVACIIIVILCNIRYNNIEQKRLGQAGRSGIIRATESKRLRIALSNITGFTKQISKSRSFSASTSDVTADNNDAQTAQLPLFANSGTNAQSKSNKIQHPVIGDRVKTKDNKYGKVAFVDTVNGAGSDANVYILLKLENDNSQVLVPLDSVIMNFGQKKSDDKKAEESISPIQHFNSRKQLTKVTKPISLRTVIDDKILKASLAPLKAGCESSEEEEDIEDILSDDEDYKTVAGAVNITNTTPKQAKTPHAKKQKSAPASLGMNVLTQNVIVEGEESKHEPHTEDMLCFCIAQHRVDGIDKKLETVCNVPQKTLICATFSLLCATLIVVVLVWEMLTTDATMTLFDDVMAKHEWLAIQDHVYQLFSSTTQIADIVTDRFYRNDMDLTDSKSLDRYFLNLMQSFIHPLGLYMQWYVYIATPDGNMRGVRWIDSPNVTDLAAGIRDGTTNGSYALYLINERDGYHMKHSVVDSNAIYDPRCRGWYLDALYYSFQGTNDQAFPNQTYKEWVLGTNGAMPTNCEENQALYMEMWNITNVSRSEEWENNTWKYDGTQHDMVWSRYLFVSTENPQIGLTGSRTIINPQTGELLAIVSVDYSLKYLSNMLANTVNNPYDDGRSNVKYDHWKAWIFETKPEYAMIASSDGQVLRNATETEGCYGYLVTVENQKVPHNAKEHPDWLIQVYSKEMIDVHDIDSLLINATLPQNVRVPYGLPTLEAGIVQFYPGGEASIDWVVLKTMEVSDSFVNDLHITLICICCIMACIWVLLRELDYSDKLANKHKHKSASKSAQTHDIGNEDSDDYKAIMRKMKPIIQGAANATWYRLMAQNESHLNSMGCAAIITTQKAKTFLAARANNHIASENENNAVFRECAWHACAHNRYWKRFQLRYWEFIESNYYDIPVQLLLLGHLVATFWEPPTPKGLHDNGLSRKLIIVLCACQFIQWLDCILVGLKRYFEFSVSEPFLTSLYELNYGFHHKYTIRVKASRDKYQNDKLRALYLAFMGPQCRRFILHVVLVGIDLINFLLQITLSIAPFSYYIPILPLLIIIRNHHVLVFGYDFISAIIYAKDVLFSYFCFILIFAILTMSLFRDTVNYDQVADSFQAINSAFITGFVFISTSENYAIMYDVFESEYYDATSQHWLVVGNVVLITIFFAMMGMFCWIPMIIDKFEHAFEQSNMKHDQKNKLRKTNAIIAAFVMLDFNNDLEIDSSEFNCLITSSVLIDKNKLFSAFDTNANDTLDIYEFVSCLLKQSFRSKIISTASHVPQLKFNAWCECNIFRNEHYTIYIFVFLVIPVIGLSVIRGLLHRFSEVAIDKSIIFFSLLNMIEIHLRCFCFGINRFLDLLKYPNPNYIIAAIQKYQTNHLKKHRKARLNTTYNYNNDDVNTNTIRLTSSERDWVSKHLTAVRPASILEKSTQTLINRVEIIVFWFCLCAAAVFFILFKFQAKYSPNHADASYGTNEIANQVINNRYCLYFIQFAVMVRIFTLIPSNQKLIYIVFVVFPSFVALFAFLGLYIYAWARIGCTLFGDYRTDIVIAEIYEPAEDMVANFDSLPYAILALIQLMIGEGWHEIMYFNIIATQQIAAHALYFIIYITIVSIIIANVFVGLFLADIDTLTQQQSHDDILQHSTKLKSFQVYAAQKVNKLNYQIRQNIHHNHLMEKQIQHIHFILQQQQLSE